jgi:GTP-binding protein
VGKSSLVNALIGEDRTIVSDIAGTTRDAIDSTFKYFGRDYIIIDTAGMRRRSRIDISIEKFSVIRALRAVDRADVVLVVIDATSGVTEQDTKILGYAHEAGKAIIIVVNKWDLVAKDDKTMKKFDELVRTELAYAHYAPILYVSALTKQRIGKIMEVVDFVTEQQNLRIATPVLNDLIKEVVRLTPPPTDKGKRLKILYATQASVKPPTFILFVNSPELMHFSYRRYIENQLRKSFGFEGNPIRIVIRKREQKDT